MNNNEYLTLKEVDERNALQTAEKKGEKRGELKAKIEIAKKMLEDNMPIEVIIKYSGLEEKELLKLKEKE